MTSGVSKVRVPSPISSVAQGRPGPVGPRGQKGEAALTVSVGLGGLEPPTPCCPSVTRGVLIVLVVLCSQEDDIRAFVRQEMSQHCGKCSQAWRLLAPVPAPPWAPWTGQTDQLEWGRGEEEGDWEGSVTQGLGKKDGHTDPGPAGLALGKADTRQTGLATEYPCTSSVEGLEQEQSLSQQVQLWGTQGHQSDALCLPSLLLLLHPCPPAPPPLPPVFSSAPNTLLSLASVFLAFLLSHSFCLSTTHFSLCHSLLLSLPHRVSLSSGLSISTIPSFYLPLCCLPCSLPACQGQFSASGSRE